MKFIICFIGILTASSVSMASKARLEALGQDTNGSYFIMDNRNIFLNPASISGFENQINLEVGNSVSPKAEGGLINKSSFGTLGLHLGRYGMGAQNIMSAELTPTSLTLFKPQNSVELLYGKELSNINIGFALLYANSSSDTGETVNLPDSTSTVTTFRAGVEANKFGALLVYGLTEESKTENTATTNIEYDGKNSIKLGGYYNFTDNTKLSAEIKQVDFNFDDGTGTVTGERGSQEIGINFYNKLTGDEDYFVFYTIGLTQAEYTVDYDQVAADDIEDKRMYLPIVIGGEAKVKEWLTLRASVKQNTMIDDVDYKDNVNNKKTSNIDDTVVAAGLGLNFGRVTIDSVFAGVSSGSGKIDGNEFLAKTAFKYTY
ncbi:MAG: hypothetical protein KDD58_06015 [Bdellovibrionales bacterium]|nr:hypothetical protein [Bdellovibrionales bacterium]